MRPLVLLSGLAPGGAERVTVGFLRRLADRDRSVPLCTVTARTDGPPAEEARAAGLERHDLGARRLLDPVAFVRLVRLLRRGDVDLVHAHGQDAAILAAWALRLVPFRLVITRHVVEETAPGLRARVRAELSLRALRRAHAVVAVSEAAARRLTLEGGVSPDRVRVIPNGIDLGAFECDRGGEVGAALRRELGIAPEEPVVLMPAVLRPGKGHDLLLEAAPRILESIPGARFVVAGGGELESRVRKEAAGLGDRMLVLGHRDDVPALLAASDLVVLPSRSEALPTVALEAAAAGRPLVATRVGGIPEVVLHARTGVLVPPGDAEALAGAVVALLRDPPRREALGRAARELALARFDIDGQVARTVELWERVAREGRP